MRLALAQINSVLGDFDANKKSILTAIERAVLRRCDLVIFPEAALFGYHPVDLLERPSIVIEQERVMREIHKSLPKGLGVLLGAFVRNTTQKGKGFWNAAVFLEKGGKPRIFAKQLLPTYDVFDEGRHIEPGRTENNILRLGNKRILVTICEDIWAWPLKGNPWYSKYGKNPLAQISPRSVDLVVNLSASPFTQSKLERRQLVTRSTVKHFKKPMVYVNMVGGQDELIFDGGSFALDAKGKILAQSMRFEEDFNVVDLKENSAWIRELSEEPQEVLRSALVLGLRDFVRKTGFTRLHLGLSGGVDSALVACLAADAIGPMNVTAVSLPSQFTSSGSREWAAQLAENLGIRYVELPIQKPYDTLLWEFETAFGKKEFSVMNENLQSRIRGLMLMSVSNRENSLLLGTTNKSELCVGYGTLYGDLVGGLMPIGDLLKTEVFELARYYNRESELIPTQIIERAPSAELRENQTDQDSLPPYEKLDPIVKRLVEGMHSPRNEIEKKILSMMMKSEFKRWQSPPILKVSDHAFGRGRRFPIAHAAKV